MKLRLAAALFCGTLPVVAQAQEAPKPVTVTGSVAVVSDYRFRGVSQSDKEFAVQGGFTVNHESGLYAGTWGSNLGGWGTFGGPNLELDLFAGYKVPVGGGSLDIGLTWFMYPGGASETDFAEPYVKLSGTVGPATLLAGVAYAPKQQALGRWYFSGADASAGVYNDPGDKEDNLYIWGDASTAVTGTPITAKAHIGYSNGNPGLGPNGTSIAPTGKYWDWMIGADVALGPVVLGISYVDTDISKRQAAYLQPNFSDTENGSSIASGRLVFSAGVSF